MSYFILKSGEDGTSIDGPFTKEALLERITPNMHGDTYYGTHGFHSKIPSSDKGCWDEREGNEKLLIIRGEIVVPTAKATVTEWDLPNGGEAGK